MTDTPESRQHALEKSATLATVERIQARRKEKTRRLGHTRAGGMVMRTQVVPLESTIDLAQKEVADGRDTSAEGMAFLALPAPFLAVITLKAIISAVSLRTPEKPISFYPLAKTIGTWCALEYVHIQGSPWEQNLVERWTRRSPSNPWQARKLAEAKLKRFREADWQEEGWDLKLGARLVDIAIASTGLLTKWMEQKKHKTSLVLTLTEGACGKIEELLKLEESLVRPQREPMVARALPWTGLFDGGYLTHRLPLVKHHKSSHRLELLHRSDLSQACQAVNALQEVEWRINKPAFLLLETAYQRKAPLEVLKLEPEEALQAPEAGRDPEDAARDQAPDKADEFEAARAEERKASSEVVVQQALAIGRKFLDEPGLFFPHHLDSRGRAYPFPRLVNPQGDDRGRGLIEFRTGKPLGERGADELRIHLANLYGEVDKEPFAERIKWVDEHREAILDSADKPLDGARFWAKADKPLRFWAAAREYAGFVREGPSFQSHLPIARDGTCNGLQHYSALGLDKVGGLHTNLIPSARMQDIYRVVAEATHREVETRAAAGDWWANPWLGRITRKTVKPPTMMTPYAVTLAGIRRQLEEHIKAEHPGAFLDPWGAADWLAPLLQKVIGGVVVAAVEIMKWLREVVGLFAGKGQGVSWTLPTGFRVLQEERATKKKRIRTLAHTLEVYEHDPEGRIQLTEQRNGIAANLVHSLDAAHMMKTVLALKGAGITDVAMVHDSYAVHACDVPRMDRVLREEFVRLHQEFTLQSLWQELRRQAPTRLEIPPPPAVGTLDLEGVKDSEYFFS